MTTGTPSLAAHKPRSEAEMLREMIGEALKVANWADLHLRNINAREEPEAYRDRSRETLAQIIAILKKGAP